MLPFIFIILAYSGLNAYVCLRGWQALPPIPGLRITYLVVYILLTYGYFALFLLHKYLPLGLAKCLDIICSAWPVIFLYLLMAVLLIDLLRIVNHFLPFFPAGLQQPTAQTKLLVLAAVCCLLTGIFAAGYHRFNHPKTVHLALTIDKELLERPLRMVMVSDLHIGYAIGPKRLQSYVDKINALQPELVVIVGDLLNSQLEPVQRMHMDEILRKIEAPLGRYMVLGNHEYIGGGLEERIAYLEGAGLRVLRDELAELPIGLSLVGRDDRSNAHRASLDSLMNGRDPRRAYILLDHQPYHLEEAAQQGLDVMLCGHTHSGQIWPASLLVRRMYELPQGYMQRNDTHYYVSSGLGIWGPPFRIGTDSELVLIDLQAPSK